MASAQSKSAKTVYYKRQAVAINMKSMGNKCAAKHDDEACMWRCLQLARLGMGYVAPNPMVGAVLTLPEEHNQIIGEAFHAYFGGPHAEAALLHKMEGDPRLPYSRLYVSLEPCAHHGKTPPCAEHILRAGIPEVVMATRDPHPKVAGKGKSMLEQAGVSVKEGMLQEEAQALNRAFWLHHLPLRPYVVLKWAESADGFLTDKPGTPTAITHAHANRLVHRLRHRCQAILVGAGTMAADRPRLNTRYWPGTDPVVVVADRKLSLDPMAYTALQQPGALVLNHQCENLEAQPALLRIADWDNVEEWLAKIATQNVDSVLVEGGADTLRRFISQNMWDELWQFKAMDVYLENGLPAPDLPPKKPHSCWQLNGNLITYWKHDE